MEWGYAAGGAAWAWLADEKTAGATGCWYIADWEASQDRPDVRSASAGVGGSTGRPSTVNSAA